MFPAFLKGTRRGEVNFFLFAALLAFLAMPGQAASLPPGSCEAVLCWLQAETAAVPVQSANLLALTAPQRAVTEKTSPTAPILSAATSHCGQNSASPALLAPQNTPLPPLLLTFHEAGQRSGVRFNSNRE